MESVSHGLRKEKYGGVPSFIKEHQCANFQRTWNRSHLFFLKLLTVGKAPTVSPISIKE
jgi:hypothetical protein